MSLLLQPLSDVLFAVSCKFTSALVTPLHDVNSVYSSFFHPETDEKQLVQLINSVADPI